MKKIFLQIFALVIGLFLTVTVSSASENVVFSTTDTANAILETSTGTWCGYCPCGHQIISSILSSYPKTVVLCYHGPPNYGNPQDPWASVGYPMIQLFGITSYPMGVINRSTGAVSRSAWSSYVASYTTTNAAVRVILTNPTINNTTRKITGTITATALQNLTGAYSIFIAITENHLIYPQNIYSACGTAGIQNDYIHDHVVRALVTPTTGTQITAGPWNINEILTYNLDYTVTDASIALANCQVNIFVYKQGTPYTSGAPVQNGMTAPTSQFIPTGINKFETTATEYSLSQNYPNPFNPSTEIKFSLPLDGFVSMKVYNILGIEVETLVRENLKAGEYSVSWDASGFPGGVYFYTINTNQFRETKRMILLK